MSTEANHLDSLFRDRARAYLQAGLSVLPAKLAEKRAALPRWKQYQERLPTAHEVEGWFSNSHEALCIVTGAVSGNLEMIDFDQLAEMFDPWSGLVRQAATGLLEKLVLEHSKSGGRHVWYRCEAPVCGNLKLAQRAIAVPNGQAVVIHGKSYKPQKKGDRYEVIVTYIETRGEGGLCLCDPTPGYELEQGSFTVIPLITEREREILLEAAWALNEYFPEVEHGPANGLAAERPGDDYNARGDLDELLQRHGWTLVKTGENQYWRRPGKDAGWSATCKDRILYVFSSNAAPFEQGRGYAPFSVYTLLEYSGDFVAAAKALRAQGYGQDSVVEAPEVDISGITGQLDADDDAPEEETSAADPGPVPEGLLRIPGFISEVMDFCLLVSPYPSVGMSFSGALALQSFLCGRKVRDPGDLRTNLYLLALAGASAGKDHARKVNARILMEIGMQECLGDKFASGEGLQDALFQNPSMLYQNDEIDGLLMNINKSRDARYESIVGTLLTLFTSSGSIYPMRRKAGKQHPGIIDQPHLTLFGTATPKYYYEALSERMLTNGFFARTISMDTGKRSRGQSPGLLDHIPASILEIADWWRRFQPGEHHSNLRNLHPLPAVVPYHPDAQRVLDEFRERADDEYTLAEDRIDEVSKTVWGRANENTRKLALIYACSENYREPLISEAAARWAVQFIDRQTRRMLFMAAEHVAKNEFDAMCKEMLRELRKWQDRKGGEWMPEYELNRRLSWRPRDHEDVRNALIAQRRIRYEVQTTRTRTRPVYRLR